MKKKLIIVLAVLLVLIGSGVFIFSQQANAPDNGESRGDSTSSAESNAPKETKVITASEVATHNTESDCWTTIGNSVYDITSYIPRHPGGDEILKACGTDGTSLFEERRDSNGQQVGSGTPHSANATNQLEPLKIGELAN